MRIANLKAREILDSRGTPTIEVEVLTDTGLKATAAVPSGASTGKREAVELRDGDPKRYFGKGVLKAIGYVNGPLNELLKGKNITEQASIDYAMIEAEGTANKSRWGANALLGISLAVARAGALANNLPLYLYLNRLLKPARTPSLPCPMINILNGGAHANNGLDFQEFMIRPIRAPTFQEGLRWSAEVFVCLKNLLRSQGHSIAVGDEGGFAPSLGSHEEALNLIMKAIEQAGYIPGQDISLCLDCAASEFYDSSTHLYRKCVSTEGMIDYLEGLVASYPIDSIEDGLAEEDWEGWRQLTARLGKKVQIVGDDLFVSQAPFLRRGIAEKTANAILIKPNQVGTLTETLETIALAQENGFGTIISHRSGETEDTFIADLAVGTGAGQIKTGSLSRSDRTAKYNRLLALSDIIA